MNVEEKTRVYRFNNGATLELHHVTDVTVSPSAHRVVCDEGYVLIERAHVLYTVFPSEAKAF